MNKDIIASSTSPDQDHIALATIDAMITIWNIRDAKIKYEIHGSKDIQSSKNIMIGVNQSIMLNHLHALHLCPIHQMDHVL